MPKPYLSVIVPAYNEAERIPTTLLDIDRTLAAKRYSYEILVVNDGSKDATAEIVRNMVPAVKGLKLVDNTENKGKGSAVRQGRRVATGSYRLFLDAANSTSIGHFDTMIPYFEEGYAVVIGSRTAKGSTLDPPQPLSHQIPGKLGNLFIQLMLLPGIWDTQCGFKAFREDAAEKIFQGMRIARWGFDVEALALARRYGYRIKEVPVHWMNDIRSHVSAAAYLQVLVEVMRIKWWMIRGEYKQNA